MAKTNTPPDKTPKPASLYAAPALEKGFNIIELLGTAPDGLTIAEMATRFQCSISEIFRVIMVMERRGWLYKNPEGDRFRVTHKVVDLAFRASPAQALSVVAAPLMKALAHQIDQSCHLVVPNDAKGLVILRQENPGPTVFSVRLGVEIDLIKSCSGNVLLAFSETAHIDRIAQALTAEARAELDARLSHIQAQGYNLVASARTRGVTDISYPIFGVNGHLAAALTVPFLELIDGSQTVKKSAARACLSDTAALISQGMGWHG